MTRSLRRLPRFTVVLLAMCASVAVTSDGAAAVPVAPALKPPVERIAFSRSDKHYEQHARVIAPDGTNNRHVAADASEPHFSADGTRMLFSRYTDDWHGEAWTSTTDGSDERRITSLYGSSQFVWSPDETEIAYRRWVEYGMVNVFVMDSDGSDSRRLLHYPANDLDPVWTPDGTSIVTGRIDAPSRLWMLRPDGTEAHPVNETLMYHELQPDVSPDGKWIVFAGEPGFLQGTEQPYWAIFLIGIDGTGLRQLTPATYTHWQQTPIFSPDGQRIVFRKQKPYTADSLSGLWIVNFDGSGLRQLTSNHIDIPSDWKSNVRFAQSPNQKPTAIGTVRNVPPKLVFANASASRDNDGTIVSYEWQWGDHSPPTRHKYAWHRYAEPGTYLVRLAVTDSNGARGTRRAWVTVR